MWVWIGYWLTLVVELCPSGVLTIFKIEVPSVVWDLSVDCSWKWTTKGIQQRCQWHYLGEASLSGSMFIVRTFRKGLALPPTPTPVLWTEDLVPVRQLLQPWVSASSALSHFVPWLTLNSLCSLGLPWVCGPFASTSQVFGITVCMVPTICLCVCLRPTY